MSDINYFELFDLPVQFEIDDDKLTENYKKLMTQWHPDKAAAKSEFEKKQAMMMATTVNDAHETLQHALKRASYMLSLEGLNAESETDTQFEPSFLMEQMQWRETMEDAVNDKDEEALANLLIEVFGAYNNKLLNIADAFNQKKSQEAVGFVREGQFLIKLIGQITEHNTTA